MKSATIRHGVPRIHGQVHEDLMDLTRVRMDHRLITAPLDLQRHHPALQEIDVPVLHLGPLQRRIRVEPRHPVVLPQPVPRKGEVNAWDNEDFVNAVKKTGRKQLIIAGVVTEVCVAFPALSAIAEGYDVFVVTDASGTFNEVTRHSAWNRMAAAGVQLMTWFGVACELHRDWRNDVEGLGRLFSNHLPAYRNLITSYNAK
jgi:nicotinamidase-related amidase